MSTTSVIFRIRKGQDHGQVYIRYSHGADQKPFEIKVLPNNVDIKHWDKKNKCIKKQVVNATILNALIREKVNDIERIVCELQIAKQNPTPQAVYQILFPVQKNESIKGLFQEFIDVYIINKYSKNTYLSYKCVFQALSEFINMNAVNDDIKVIDQAFVHDFQRFLTQTKKQSSASSSLYLSKLNIFKEWLSAHKDCEVRFSVKVLSGKKSGVRREKVALTMEELDILQNAQIDDTKIDDTRTLFLFSCYTGMRISDARRFEPTWVREREFYRVIEFIDMKTNKQNTIPVLPQLEELLNRYGNKLPYVPNYGGNIKKLFKYLDFNQSILVNYEKGGQIITETVPKYQLITSHVARRTFATMLFHLNANPQLISKMMGHTSFNTTDKYYIKQKSESICKELLDIFNQYNKEISTDDED